MSSPLGVLGIAIKICIHFHNVPRGTFVQTKYKCEKICKNQPWYSFKKARDVSGDLDANPH